MRNPQDVLNNQMNYNEICHKVYFYVLDGNYQNVFNINSALKNAISIKKRFLLISTIIKRNINKCVI